MNRLLSLSSFDTFSLNRVARNHSGKQGHLAAGGVQLAHFGLHVGVADAVYDRYHA